MFWPVADGVFADAELAVDLAVVVMHGDGAVDSLPSRHDVGDDFFSSSGFDFVKVDGGDVGIFCVVWLLFYEAGDDYAFVCDAHACW